MEKRNFTRVIFSAGVAIRCNGQVILGDISNVSLQGLFIKTNATIPTNMPVEVTVYLYPKKTFSLHADVVRREWSGVGLQINKIDIKSFVHLRNVVAIKSDDHDAIVHETFKIIGCIH